MTTLIFQTVDVTEGDAGRRPWPVRVENGAVVAGRPDADWLVGFQPFDAPDGQGLVLRADVEAEPLKAVGLIPVYTGDGQMFSVATPVTDIALGDEAEIPL